MIVAACWILQVIILAAVVVEVGGWTLGRWRRPRPLWLIVALWCVQVGLLVAFYMIGAALW